MRARLRERVGPWRAVWPRYVAGLLQAATIAVAVRLWNKLGLWVLAFPLAALWAVCAYVTFTRRPAESAEEPAYAYPRLRPWAFAVLIAVSLVFAAGFGAYLAVPPHRDRACTRCILSWKADLFDFGDGHDHGWRSLDWNDGWIYFTRSAETDVVGGNLELDGHRGPFLKYPLHLRSEDRYDYRYRNAVYKLVDARIAGVLANVYVKPEPKYAAKEVYAGFVIPSGSGEHREASQDFPKKLELERWNTIVWSMFGPVWWSDDEENLSDSWDDFKGSYPIESEYLHPGRRVYKLRAPWIAIQFYVATDSGYNEFRGTAYIDNIVLLYEVGS